MKSAIRSVALHGRRGVCVAATRRTLRSVLTMIILFFLMTGARAVASGPLELVVEGLTGEELDNVHAALSIPPGLVKDDAVNELWLERFIAGIPEQVQRALEPFGYYRAETLANLERVGDGRFRIMVQVEPGPQVLIAGVRVVIQGPGGAEESLLELVRKFPLKQGEVLLQKKYEQAKSAIRNRAMGLGYLDAEFSVHTIRLDPAEGSARIDLELETGPLYRFGDVRFEGERRYPEAFLLRFVTFKPGDRFSYATLGETQLNLANSDRFQEVVPAPELEYARDHAVPVVIRVRESPARRLRPGIGYATDVGPRLSMDYRDLNAFNRGNEFHAETSLSFRQQSMGASYLVHDRKDFKNSTGLQVNLKREEVSTYVTRAASAEIGRNRELGRGRLGTLYLRYLFEESTVADAAVRSRLVLPGVRFSERRVDSLVRPTSGHNVSIDVHGTHEDLGSNSRFVQVVTEGDLLTPLPWRLTLLTRMKLGTTLQNDPFREIPVSMRFFAGGDRSVRGYAYQSLGPQDDAGKVVGGRGLLAGSIELERAVFANWGVAVFYDAGNAFNSFREFSLFEGAGIGARYYTVIGGIRLDIARQINVPRPAYRLHLTVGVAF